MATEKKITIEITNENGRRFALDHLVDERGAFAYRGRKVTVRVGFESVTMPLPEFIRLIQAVDTAEKSGSEYPEDWKPFYGLSEKE